MPIKYKTYGPKKKLPPIVKGSKPSQKLRDTLYQEEVFDCLKRNIIGANTQNPRTPRPERQARAVDIRAKILQTYTDKDLLRFKSKKEKRLEKAKLTEEEWNVLCWVVNQKYPKNNAKWERRKARLLKRRTKGKKRRKYSQYETYINSLEWKDRKNKYWQKNKRRCAVCNTPKKIHLHHMHYGNFGNEPDEHLVPLCEKHHDQYHKENGVQRDMIRKTRAFIEANK